MRTSYVQEVKSAVDLSVAFFMLRSMMSFGHPMSFACFSRSASMGLLLGSAEPPALMLCV